MIPVMKFVVVGGTLFVLYIIFFYVWMRLWRE